MAYFYAWFSDPELTQLSATKIHQRVLEKFDVRISMGSNERLMVISGHDITISAITTTLGLNSWQCLNESYFNPLVNETNCPRKPVFATHIHYELHHTAEAGHFVKFFHNGLQFDICGDKTAKDTGADCPLDDFRSLMDEVILTSD